MKKTIILIASILAISCSKKNNENSNEKIDSSNPPEEATNQIAEKAKFYILNDGNTVTDEDGISHQIKLEIDDNSKVELYKSETIKTDSGNSITVYAYKTSFKFIYIDNSQTIDSVRFDGYQFETIPLMPGEKEIPRGSFIGRFCAHSMAYIPELGEDSFEELFGKTIFYGNKKELISKFSSINCGNGEPTNGKVLQMNISALKKSGIVD